MVGADGRIRQQRQNHGMKTLPYRKDDPPSGPTASRPRAAARCGPWLLQDRHGPRLHSPYLTIVGTGAPPMPSSLARGHYGGAASSQRPRRRGFDPAARAGRWKGLRRRNGSTLGRGRGVSARGRWGDASFWRPSWGSPSGPLEAPARDEETSICGLRQAL